MESIDALAKAINQFDGGLVLVSHDMRLISQVAREIWICDNKTIEIYKGDIQKFKMKMRAQLGLDGEQKPQLRGDFSEKQNETKPEPKPKPKPSKPKNEHQEKPQEFTPEPPPPTPKVRDPAPDETTTPVAAAAPSATSDPPRSRYVPPHLRKKMQEQQ